MPEGAKLLIEGEMMKIYALKTCDTCRRAIKELSARQPGLTVIDLRAEPISRADLTRFHDALGTALVNRASTTWRGLDEAERQRDPVDLLAAHPTLMKRPLIETDGQLYLGWKDDVRARLLG